MICRSLEFNLWMHMSCNPCLGSVIWMMRKLDALPECWFGMDVKAKRGRKRVRVAIMVSKNHMKLHLQSAQLICPPIHLSVSDGWRVMKQIAKNPYRGCIGFGDGV